MVRTKLNLDDLISSKVDEAISQDRTLSLTTYSYLPDERDHIDKILDLFLVEMGFPTLRNKVSYCLHELAANAKKAHTKRVFFKEQGLDISNPADYEKGMSMFKSETIQNIDHYLKLQKKQKLYIKFQFLKINDGLKIVVRNNNPLLPAEIEKIQEKIRAARHFSCMAEAYSAVQDDSEGAGLGIVMMLVMLKVLGFGEDALDIYTHKGETISLLNLKFSEALEISA